MAKFPTSVINDMKRSIAEEYDKHGTAEALRECYERHIRNYTGQFDPHKLAAWGRSNIELYKQLTDNDRPNFEPYKSEPMNVYKELDRIKAYETEQLVKALEATETKSFDFEEDEFPVVTYYDRMNCDPNKLYVESVRLSEDGGTVKIYGSGEECEGTDVVAGDLTEILNHIKS